MCTDSDNPFNIFYGSLTLWFQLSKHWCIHFLLKQYAMIQLDYCTFWPLLQLFERAFPREQIHCFCFQTLELNVQPEFLGACSLLSHPPNLSLFPSHSHHIKQSNQQMLNAALSTLFQHLSQVYKILSELILHYSSIKQTNRCHNIAQKPKPR